MEPKTEPTRADLLFGRAATAWWLPAPLARLARLAYLSVAEFNRNRCAEKAAALSYETTLSFVPALVLALFLVRSFGGLEDLSRELPAQFLHQLNIDQIVLSLPAEGGAPGAKVRVKLSDKIQELAETADQALRSSGASVFSLAGLALAAIFLALTLERSLNDIWASHGRRRLLLRVALAWTMLTLGPLLVGLSLAAIRGYSPPAGMSSFVMSMLGPFLVLSILYKFVPAAPVSASAALLGSVVASAGWVAARWGFGYYLRYAVSVDWLYGALGLLPIGLIWVWLAWIIVLSGAEVAYTLENLTRLTAIERRRRLAPFVAPGMTGLALVLRVGQAFREGKGPVTGADIAEATGLSEHLWNRLIAVLLERNILVAAGGNGRGFTPGKPLEQLRVEDVLSAVEEALLARSEDCWPGEPNPLGGLESRLALARGKELGRRSVAELLDEMS